MYGLTNGRRPARRRAVRGRIAGLLAVTTLGALLSGCGIRATEVPTDFGPAPSRVRCSLGEPGVSSRADRGLPVQVFLLCGASLVAVDRTVRVPDGAADSGRRTLIAQELLDELSAPPSADEKEAGYTTLVRDGLTVSGPRPGDPEDTLRLSAAPADLSSTALAQIVCTFSDSAATDNGSVILGGPGSAAPLRYECTDQVRARPAGERPPASQLTDE
ncbi:lipoprotein [Streptomyces thermocarboxydovorans]|uniref:Lipoprotein n=1 Tax=Streptomyces thermocarboxydovorans TaxID=59298 RepID=A0ABP3SXR6_9ACTN